MDHFILIDHNCGSRDAGDFFAARSADPGEALGPMVAAKQCGPGWQIFERSGR
jgi:hypothetical protein